MKTQIASIPAEFGEFPSGPLWCEIADDFTDERTLTAAVDRWVGTSIDTVTAGTVAWTDAAFGNLVLGSTAATDGYQVQGDMEVFVPASGKDTDFLVRITRSATTCMVYAGLAITDSTLMATTSSLADGLTATDAIGILIVGTVAYGVIRTGGTQTSVTLTGTAGITAERYSFKCHLTAAATGVIQFFKNGSLVGSLTSSGITTELMALSFASQDNDGAGTSTAFDMIACKQER